MYTTLRYQSRKPQDTLYTRGPLEQIILTSLVLNFFVSCARHRALEGYLRVYTQLNIGLVLNYVSCKRRRVLEGYLHVYTQLNIVSKRQQRASNEVREDNVRLFLDPSAMTCLAFYYLLFMIFFISFFKYYFYLSAMTCLFFHLPPASENAITKVIIFICLL